jgi:adenylate cyclase
LTEGERRLAAIMFTDMVGFTALTQSDEAQSLAVLERHNRLLRPIFARFRGREVKTIGDSFLVEFDSALDATNCAVEIQRFLHDYNMSSRDEWKITLRIGVHLGDVVRSGDDILGDAVNIASRLQPFALPEGVCISEQVYDQVRNKVPQALVKLESHELEGVKFSVDVYKVMMPWEKQPAAVPAQDRNRVAVLPFANMSPDPNDEYFADGMTEELIDRLAHVKGLEVIARTSVMSYKKKEKKVNEIAKELLVGSVVEGSVRKAGNRVRVTAQLIDAATEGHVWSEHYDGTLDDIFAVQSEIAEKVAGELKVQLLQSEKRTLEKKPTENMESYSLYLRGLQYSHEDRVDLKKKAIRYFEQAIGLDPNFIPAYVEASKLYFLFGNMGYMTPTEAHDKGVTLLAEAQELDPDSSDVQVLLANSRYGNYDWLGAEALLKRAIEGSPSNAQARRDRAGVLAILGRFDESLVESLKSEELDPLGSRGLFKAVLPYFERDYDEAIAEALRILDRDPEFFDARVFLGYAYLAKSMFPEAIAEFQKNVELAAGGPTNWSKSDLAVAFAKSGRREEATKILEGLRIMAQTEYVPPDVIAVVEWALGNASKALELFEKAYEEKSNAWIQWLGVYPLFDDLRSDERFAPFLRKVGFLT